MSRSRTQAGRGCDGAPAIRYSAFVNPSTTVRRFRTIALAEGLSFLVLLGIAMPLKYLAGMPEAVRWAGWTHGLLFMAYVAMAAQVFSQEDWPLSRAPGVFLAAVVPFGTFVLDRKWLR
jgi:integral membrane protein